MTTYNQIQEELLAGLIWNSEKQDYMLEKGNKNTVWYGVLDQDYAYQDENGNWWINGDVVAEELQKAAEY